MPRGRRFPLAGNGRSAGHRPRAPVRPIYTNPLWDGIRPSFPAHIQPRRRRSSRRSRPMQDRSRSAAHWRSPPGGSTRVVWCSAPCRFRIRTRICTRDRPAEFRHGRSELRSPWPSGVWRRKTMTSANRYAWGRVQGYPRMRIPAPDGRSAIRIAGRPGAGRFSVLPPARQSPPSASSATYRPRSDRHAILRLTDLRRWIAGMSSGLSPSPISDLLRGIPRWPHWIEQSTRLGTPFHFPSVRLRYCRVVAHFALWGTLQQLCGGPSEITQPLNGKMAGPRVFSDFRRRRNHHEQNTELV